MLVWIYRRRVQCDECCQHIMCSHLATTYCCRSSGWDQAVSCHVVCCFLLVFPYHAFCWEGRKTSSMDCDGLQLGPVHCSATVWSSYTDYWAHLVPPSIRGSFTKCSVMEIWNQLLISISVEVKDKWEFCLYCPPVKIGHGEWWLELFNLDYSLVWRRRMNVNRKCGCGTIILPVVLYGCETLHLTLKGEHQGY
jgi:hypothetical protein